MVCTGCPVLGIDGVGTKGRVGNEHTRVSHKAGWEGAPDIGSSGVDQAGELVVVGCVEEEMAVAVICVHDFDFVEVIISVQSEGVECDIAVDRCCLRGPLE